MVKCPRCGTELSKAKKEWDYFIYHVKMFFCSKCQKSVRAYYRESKLHHTIPKGKS
jgi:DNA-directed RNA polymerase subunit M/transcription elongation factor TFIIS